VSKPKQPNDPLLTFDMLWTMVASTEQPAGGSGSAGRSRRAAPACRDGKSPAVLDFVRCPTPLRGGHVIDQRQAQITIPLPTARQPADD